MAIIKENTTLKTTISGWSLKATHVAQITIGLIVGAASKKPIAIDVGAPCTINRRATGTLPHSHTGNRKPQERDFWVLFPPMSAHRRKIAAYWRIKLPATKKVSPLLTD